MKYDIKTEEGVMKLAEDYATYYLIKKYLDTKDTNVLEELKKMLIDSIQKRNGYVFDKEQKVYDPPKEKIIDIDSIDIPYPRGHNWEGLTPRQVNESYAKIDKEKGESSIVACPEKNLIQSTGYIRKRITF